MIIIKILGILLLCYSWIILNISAYLCGQEIRGSFRQIFLRTFTLGMYDYE